MANHKSTLKRVRQTEKRRVHNRYYAKSMRNALKAFRELTDKKAAEDSYPKVISLIDKNAKRDIIHKNKASNLKSKLALLINRLG